MRRNTSRNFLPDILRKQNIRQKDSYQFDIKEKNGICES